MVADGADRAGLNQLNRIDREVQSLIEQAVAEAKSAPPPTEADLLTDVYASY